MLRFCCYLPLENNESFKVPSRNYNETYISALLFFLFIGLKNLYKKMNVEPSTREKTVKKVDFQ